jgi:hypothetical protein
MGKYSSWMLQRDSGMTKQFVFRSSISRPKEKSRKTVFAALVTDRQTLLFRNIMWFTGNIVWPFCFASYLHCWSWNILNSFLYQMQLWFMFCKVRTSFAFTRTVGLNTVMKSVKRKKITAADKIIPDSLGFFNNPVLHNIHDHCGWTNDVSSWNYKQVACNGRPRRVDM